MKPYSITSISNINDLPNEKGEYQYTIVKVDDNDVTPTIIWAVSFKDATAIYLSNLNK